jgi:hypothetical protein
MDRSLSGTATFARPTKLVGHPDLSSDRMVSYLQDQVPTITQAISMITT